MQLLCQVLAIFALLWAKSIADTIDKCKYEKEWSIPYDAPFAFERIKSARDDTFLYAACLPDNSTSDNSTSDNSTSFCTWTLFEKPNTPFESKVCHTNLKYEEKFWPESVMLYRLNEDKVLLYYTISENNRELHRANVIDIIKCESYVLVDIPFATYFNIIPYNDSFSVVYDKQSISGSEGKYIINYNIFTGEETNTIRFNSPIFLEYVEAVTPYSSEDGFWFFGTILNKSPDDKDYYEAHLLHVSRNGVQKNLYKSEWDFEKIIPYSLFYSTANKLFTFCTKSRKLKDPKLGCVQIDLTGKVIMNFTRVLNADHVFESPQSVDYIYNLPDGSFLHIFNECENLNCSKCIVENIRSDSKFDTQINDANLDSIFTSSVGKSMIIDIIEDNDKFNFYVLNEYKNLFTGMIKDFDPKYREVRNFMLKKVCLPSESIYGK